MTSHCWEWNKRFNVRQIKAARALLGMNQAQLAETCGVSVQTIKRLEAKEGIMEGRDWVVQNIRSSLEACGIDFIEEADGAIGLVYRAPPPRKSMTAK